MLPGQMRMMYKMECPEGMAAGRQQENGDWKERKKACGNSQEQRFPQAVRNSYLPWNAYFLEAKTKRIMVITSSRPAQIQKGRI